MGIKGNHSPVSTPSCCFLHVVKEARVLNSFPLFYYMRKKLGVETGNEASIDHVIEYTLT